MKLVAGRAEDGAAEDGAAEDGVAEVGAAAVDVAAGGEPPAGGGAAEGGGGTHPQQAAKATNTSHAWARMISLVELKVFAAIAAWRRRPDYTGRQLPPRSFDRIFPACHHGRLSSTHSR
jgi:hypothetical protein